MSEKTRVFLGSFVQQLELYARLTMSHQDLYKSVYAEQLHDMDSVYKSQMAMTQSWASDYVNRAVQAKMGRLGARDAFFGADISNLTSLMVQGWTSRFNTDALLKDLQEKRVMIAHQDQMQDSEYRRLDKLWRTDAIGKAIGYLGSAAGISVSSAKPSLFEKILGYGISAASVASRFMRQGGGQTDPGGSWGTEDSGGDLV